MCFILVFLKWLCFLPSLLSFPFLCFPSFFPPVFENEIQEEKSTRLKIWHVFWSLIEINSKGSFSVYHFDCLKKEGEAA